MSNYNLHFFCKLKKFAKSRILFIYFNPFFSHFIFLFRFFFQTIAQTNKYSNPPPPRYNPGPLQAEGPNKCGKMWNRCIFWKIRGWEAHPMYRKCTFHLCT